MTNIDPSTTAVIGLVDAANRHYLAGGERILTARATHADPRETAAAALESAVSDLLDVWDEHRLWQSSGTLRSELDAMHRLRARAADLRAGEQTTPHCSDWDGS